LDERGPDAVDVPVTVGQVVDFLLDSCRQSSKLHSLLDFYAKPPARRKT
jgi:hypothetical protein